MTHPPFTCRNTLERLRESYDEQQRKEQDTNSMKIVRVEYTVRITGEDGKSVSVNKERILSELDSTDPKKIQQVLEQDIRTSEQFEKKCSGLSPFDAEDHRLMPTGDDEQL